MVRPLPGSTLRLVQTIDVVTPMTDDPEAFGAVAAANALSDVYAMGGTPTVALSFIGFPSDKLPLEVLGAIARGMRAACDEAGCAIVGGHTIIDPEPKAGLAVTGVVDADAIWSHSRARAGQALVLTKAIGTGVAVQALKKGDADPAVSAAALASMRRLNGRAREVALGFGVSAATDVTGFGLLGHLKHIVEASGLSAVLDAGAVPMLPGVRELAARGVVPGGSKRNLRYVEGTTRFHDSVDETTRLLLADAQTSGGLLLCVPSDRAAALARALVAAGELGVVVGELAAHEPGAPHLVVR